jgi:hypothetical protein
LLANVSFHGTLAAIGILTAYLVEIWMDPDRAKWRLSRQFVVAAVVFLIVLAVVAIEVWPPQTLRSSLIFIRMSSLITIVGDCGQFWVRPPSSDINESIPCLASQHPDVIVVSLWQVGATDEDRLVQSLSDGRVPGHLKVPWGLCFGNRES